MTDQPQGLMKSVLEPSPSELKRIRAGFKGGFCYESELMETPRKAATIAANIGAKSWTIFPMLDDHARRVIVEFYNWPGIGIYNFDDPFRTNKKKFYWWFKAKLPEYWTDPQWKHTSKEHERPYDPRE